MREKGERGREGDKGGERRGLMDGWMDPIDDFRTRWHF
jgi:hypothetical protein